MNCGPLFLFTIHFRCNIVVNFVYPEVPLKLTFTIAAYAYVNGIKYLFKKMNNYISPYCSEHFCDDPLLGARPDCII